MNVQTYTALARLSRLLAALLTLPVFLGVAMLYVIVILGTWIVDGFGWKMAEDSVDDL